MEMDFPRDICSPEKGKWDGHTSWLGGYFVEAINYRRRATCHRRLARVAGAGLEPQRVYRARTPVVLALARLVVNLVFGGHMGVTSQ